MATIASMLVSLGVDPSGVQKGLQTGLQHFTKFQRTVTSAFRNVQLLNPATLAGQGKLAADSLLGALRTTYEREAGRLQQQLAAGAIDPAQFAQAGSRAAQQFNAGLARQIGQLRAAGQLTPEIEAQLKSQFKKTGTAAGDEFWLAARARLGRPGALPPVITPSQTLTQARAAAEALVQGLRVGYEQRMAALREKFARGTIDRAAFQAEGEFAAKALNQGLLDGLDDFQGANVLTDDIRATLVNGMDRVGLEAGKRAGTAIARGIQLRRQDIENKLREMGGLAASAGDALTIGLTAPLVGGATAAVKFAADFEQAMAGVKKTVNDLTEDELNALGERFQQLAQTPGFPAVEELAKIAENAGALNVAGRNVEEFVQTIAKVDLASNLNTEDAAQGLARISNILRISQSDFDKLGSSIVGVGINSASTEREIVAMALRIAGAGATLNLSAGDVVGFAGALASVGVEAEAGGTAISRVMLRVSDAVFKGGQELDNFAKVTGRTSAEFRRAFQDDAASAIVEVIEGLGRLKKEGANVSAILESIDFQDIRVRDALLRAASAGELFRETLALGNREFERNAALNEAFDRFSKTTISDLKATGREAKNLAIAFGGALNPAVRDALRILRLLLVPVRQAARAFNDLPAGVRLTIVALGALVALVGPALSLLGRMAQSLVFLKIASAGAAGFAGLGGLGTVLAVGGPVLIGLAAAAALIALVASESNKGKKEVQEFRDSLAALGQTQLLGLGASIEKQIADLKAQKDQLERVLLVPGADATAAGGRDLGGLDPATARIKYNLLTEQIRQLDAKAGDVADAFNKSAAAEAEMRAEAARLAKALGIVGGSVPDFSDPKAKLEALQGSVSDATARLLSFANTAESLAGRLFGAGDAFKLQVDTKDALRAVIGLRDQMEREIARAGGANVAPAAIVELRDSLNEALTSFREGLPQFAQGVAEAVARTVPALQGAAKQLAAQFEAGITIPMRVEFGDSDAEDAAKQLAARVKRQFEKVEVKLAVKIESDFAAVEGTLDQGILPAMKEFEKQAKRVGIDVKKIKTEADEAKDRLQSIRDIAGGIKDFASIAADMGLFNEETAEAIGHIADLGAGIARIAAGDVLGGLLQGLSGLTGALGIGESPEEKERKRIQKENNLQLARLTDKIGNLEVEITGAAFSKLQKVFATITDPSKFLLEDNTKLGNRVNALLGANGLSIDDVKDAAEQLGLTFQNTAEFYRTFARALQEVELTRFTDTFTGQLDKLQREFEVFNVTDPAEKLRRTFALLADPSVGSPAMAKAFEGVDLTTQAGLEDLQKRLQALFTNFESLTPEDLGGLTPTQFLDQLAAAAGLTREALENLVGGANEATASMLNMPTGFKTLEKLRFEAQDAEPAPIEVDLSVLKNMEASISPALVSEFDRLADTLARQQLDATGQLKPLSDALTKFATSIPADLPGAIERLGTTTPADLLGALTTLGAHSPPDLLDRLDRIREALSDDRARAVPTTPAGTTTGPVIHQHFGAGSIVIPATAQNPAAQATEFIREVRFKANRQSGDTLKHGEY